MTELTIQEVKDRKRDLESTIRALLTLFTDQTGLTVTEIRVDRALRQPGKYDYYVLTDVKL